MPVLRGRDHNQHEPSRSSGTANLFRRAGAGLLLTAGLFFGCGNKQDNNLDANIQPDSTISDANAPDTTVPDASVDKAHLSINAERESIKIGESFNFRLDADGIHAEKGRAVMFVLDVDGADVEAAIEVPLTASGDGASGSAEISTEHTGLYLAAAKLVEPLESDWTFERVGVRPDIDPYPENLLTFEVADFSGVNEQLATLEPREIDIEFPSTTVSLSLEEPVPVEGSTDTFYYPAKGRDDPTVVGGIVTSEELSSGFIDYSDASSSPFNARTIEWVPLEGSSGETVVYRDIYEKISTEVLETILPEPNPESKCISPDGIYRVSMYYDSEMNLYDAIRIMEQAKIPLEQLGKNIRWDGPHARARLDITTAHSNASFDLFKTRTDMPFPGCSAGDFKAYLTDDGIHAASRGNMVIVGSANIQRRSDVLAHEIGHGFGATHDCRGMGDQICYGWTGRPILDLGCYRYGESIQNACLLLNEIIVTSSAFSIMMNYRETPPMQCIENCPCSYIFCDPQGAFYEFVNLGTQLGCILPIFSEQSLCEIEHTWRECDEPLNETGCRDGEGCNYGTRTCYTPECFSFDVSLGVFSGLDMYGDIVTYEQQAEDHSHQYYADISTGEITLIPHSEDCLTGGRSRIYEENIILGCECGGICVYNLATGSMEPLYLEHVSDWDIYGRNVEYIQETDGIYTINILDIETGGVLSTDYLPEGEISNYWTCGGDTQYHGRRVLMNLNTEGTSHCNRWLYEDGGWTMIDIERRSNLTLYGDMIVYTVATGGAYTPSNVYVYDIPSATNTQLVPDGIIPGGGGDSVAIWENQIVLKSVDEHSLYRVDVTTGAVTGTISFPSGRYLFAPKIFENYVAYASSDGYGLFGLNACTLE